MALISDWRQYYHGLNMLMVYAPGANTKCRTYPDSNTLHGASPSKITHVNSLSSVSFYPSLIRTPCNYAFRSCSISWKGRFLPNTHHVSHLVVSKKWLVSGVERLLWIVLVSFIWFYILCKLKSSWIFGLTVPIAWFNFIWWWVSFITQHSNQFV